MKICAPARERATCSRKHKQIMIICAPARLRVRKCAPKSFKSDDLEHFWAPDGLGPDLAAAPRAEHIFKTPSKVTIWKTFGLRTALARIRRSQDGSVDTD